ncbi:hypothetical protein [Klebsiella pneumoniae IS46]|nr:hypothetical protein [Klebsiella pneumoniae IS46]
MAWSVFPQVLVQGFAADAEVTGHQGFWSPAATRRFNSAICSLFSDFFRPR